MRTFIVTYKTVYGYKTITLEYYPTNPLHLCDFIFESIKKREEGSEENVILMIYEVK